MALKELQKVTEEKVKQFINKGGTVSQPQEDSNELRFSLRIPKWLMDKIDTKRKNPIGDVSRNRLILELIEKALNE